MASCQKLTIELIKAKLINAKRELESCGKDGDRWLAGQWSGQVDAYKQLLDILESKE